MKGFKFPIKTSVFVALLVYVMCLSLTFPETNAYLKNSQSRDAISQLGDLKVTLDDATTATSIVIGQEETRQVSLTNHGQTPIFVRIAIHPVLVNSDGLQKEAKASELISDLSSVDWKDGKDGYYYYQKKIGTKADEITVPVFSKIISTSTMEKADSLTLYLKVEAITSAGTSYREAWWEGEKPSATVRPFLQETEQQLNSQKD